MTPPLNAAQIVSLAAVREAKTKQRTDYRDFSAKPHDTPMTGVGDGVVTGNSRYGDTSVTGDDGAMTAISAASRRLQSPAMLQWLKDQYSPAEAATVLTGALLLVQHIQPGGEFNATEVIKASVTDGISYRLLTDKCKPCMVHAKIWHKNSLGKFQWVGLKKYQERLNAVEMSECSVGMGAEISPNAVDKMSEPTPTKNPVEKFRQWQRDRYLHKAKADVWSKVLDDGTVQTIPKPGQGEMTEKQKELHRKAAWADHEAKLKLKIDQSSNKELAQQIQRADMEAVQQERAILNAARIKAAETRHNRQVAWERAKPFIYLGAAALIGFSLYNNQPNTTHYPAVTTTMPPVQQGKIHESP